MHSFQDRHGTQWQLSLNVAIVEQIRAEVRHPDGTPVDLWRVRDQELVQPGESSELARLLNNPPLFCQLLHICLGCDLDAFQEAMHGDGLEDATEAFLQELIDFFPRRRRALLRTILQQDRELADQETSLMVQTQQQEGQRLLESLKAPDSASGESPASLELILDHSDLASCSPCASAAPAPPGTTAPPSSPPSIT